MTARESSARLTVHFDGCSVDVDADSTSDLQWLREFSEPQFRVARGTSSNFEVFLTRDPVRYESLCNRVRDLPSSQVDCFGMDAELVRHPVWRSVDGHHVVYDREYRLYYVLDVPLRSVEIVAPDQGLWARVALFRVVRELFMSHEIAQGHLIVHGATIDVGGRSIVLSGPKESGKTSLLVHLLRQGPGRFVSNDRVVVQCEPPLEARGMPTVVSVRPGTQRLFPKIFEDRWRTGEQVCFSRWENAPARRGRDRESSVLLTPVQFVDLLGCSAAVGGPLAALVFPRVDGQVRTISVRPLDPETARSRLAEGLFRAHSPQKTGGVFAEDVRVAAESCASWQSKIGDLASRVPCFECLLGPQAYGPGTSEQFLRAVLT